MSRGRYLFSLIALLLSIGTWRKKGHSGNDLVDAYGPFSAFASISAYLDRHNGLHDQRGKLYQRIGLKYLLPGSTGLFVAMDCKAHGFSRAAMMELTLGIRL